MSNANNWAMPLHGQCQQLGNNATQELKHNQTYLVALKLEVGVFVLAVYHKVGCIASPAGYYYAAI